MPPYIFNRNRLTLPLASFLNDLGWELPILLLPFFITNVLAAGPVAVGVIEGVADSVGTLTKVLSGVLADRTGHRKRLTASGYLLANLARPLFLILTSWPGAVAIRFVERVGKGMRTSARDALLADSLNEGEMGRGFGLLRAMDSLGAFGSLLVGGLVIWLVQGNAHELREHTFRTLVLLATVPGLLSVFAIALLVKEVPARKKVGLDLTAKDGLPRQFIVFTAISAIFTLGNSSDAFVLLRSQGVGGSIVEVVALFTAFNFLYAAASRPFGTLSDRVGKRRMIIIGWLLYAAAYLGFARANGLVAIAVLLVPYAFYYAMTEGIGRAMVADLVPSGSRGAAYGIYHGALGGSALAASVVAGVLYGIAPDLPFYAGAALAGVAAILLVLVPGGNARVTS